MDIQERVVLLEKRMAELEAKSAIKDTIARHSWGMDTENWEEVAAIFTDDAIMESTPFQERNNGKEAILSFAKQHRAKFKFTNRMSNLNERITVDGNKAKASSYILVMYTHGGDSYIGWGDYEWEFRLEDSVWKITKLGVHLRVMTTLERGWGIEKDRITAPGWQPKK